MDTKRTRSKEDYPPGGGPPPEATPGTWALVFLLIAFVVGGTYAMRSSPPPAELVAEAP